MGNHGAGVQLFGAGLVDAGVRRFSPDILYPT